MFRDKQPANTQQGVGAGAALMLGNVPPLTRWNQMGFMIARKRKVGKYRKLN